MAILIMERLAFPATLGLASGVATEFVLRLTFPRGSDLETHAVSVFVGLAVLLVSWGAVNRR